MHRTTQFRSQARLRRSLGSYNPYLEVLETRLTPSIFPAQFVAKMYTDVLGRAPDPSGWAHAKNNSAYFQTACDTAHPEAFSRKQFDSSEFMGLSHAPAARTLTLYQAVLNHRPDVPGF